MNFSTPSATPVTGKGAMVNGCYQPENHQWQSYLLDGQGDGLNPMKMETAILTLAGHPKRTLAQLRSAMAKSVRGNYDPDQYPEEVKTYKQVRQHCLGCAEDARDVDKCSIYNCPFWAYRMGKNPHSGHRSKDMPTGCRFSSPTPTIISPLD